MGKKIYRITIRTDENTIKEIEEYKKKCEKIFNVEFTTADVIRIAVHIINKENIL